MAVSESNLGKLSKDTTNQLISFFHEKVESKAKVLDIIFSRFIQGLNQLHNDEMHYQLDEEFKLNYSRHVNVKFQRNVQNILDNHHDIEIKSVESLKQAMNLFCKQVLHEAKTEVCQQLDKLLYEQFNIINDALSALNKTYNDKLAKCRKSNYIEIQTAVSVERTMNSDILQKEFLKNGEECQTLRNAVHAITLQLEAEKAVKDVLHQETETLKQHCANLQDTIERQQEQQDIHQTKIHEHKRTISVLKSVVSEYIKHNKETEAKITAFEKQMKRTEHRMTRNFFQGDSNLKRIHNIQHRVDLALKVVEKLSEDPENIDEYCNSSEGWRRSKRKNMAMSPSLTRTKTKTRGSEIHPAHENPDVDNQYYSKDVSVDDKVHVECQHSIETETPSRTEIDNLKNENEALQSIIHAKEEALQKATSVMDLMKKQQEAYEALFHSKNIGRILASDTATRSIPVCDFEDVIFGYSALK